MSKTQQPLRGNGKSPLTRAQAFFEQQAKNGELDQETLKLIQSKRMSYNDAHYYVRKKLDTAGTIEILNETNVRSIGVSNLDKNKLPDNIYLVLDRVRIAYAVDATAALTAPAVTYQNTGDIPAALANGEIVISINDKPIIEMPAARFFNIGNTHVSMTIEGYLDTVELQCLKLIKPSDLIKVEVKLAQGVSLDNTKYHFLEVALFGVGTRKR